MKSALVPGTWLTIHASPAPATTFIPIPLLANPDWLGLLSTPPINVVVGTSSSAHLFPHNNTDHLKNKSGYYPWSIRMKNGFESCKMWEVVSGSETLPAKGIFAGTDTPAIWQKKDHLAKALITQCIKSELIIKVAHSKTSNKAWDLLAAEFGQTGSGSLMLWFHHLTKQFPLSGNIPTHIISFQEAVCYLANAEFEIPNYITAAILLSTLPSDPNKPSNWNNFISGIKIDKVMMTLSSVISAILEEKHWVTEDKHTDLHKKETALTMLESDAHAHGRLFCQNCWQKDHETHNCYSPGGAKEGQGLKHKKKKTRGRKGKEKAHNTKDSGDGGSNHDKSLNHVIVEHCLMMNFSDFSNYIQSDKLSTTSIKYHSHLTEDLAYSACRTSSSWSIIIDSSTSTHIHSAHNDFITLNTYSSSICGFGDGTSKVSDHGTAHIHIKLPLGSQSQLKLTNTCYVSHSSPTLISVSCLDQNNCYTLFGNGRCVTFDNRDSGRLMQTALSKPSITLSGTLGSDQLYHLDTLKSTSCKHAFLATCTPMLKLEMLHQALGHINY